MTSDVTRLLADWREQGDERALDALVPLVYEELRRLAAARLRGEREGHTLQPTALVHEAYARLVRAELSFSDRVHFFAVAAQMMRRVLVDHARRARSAKRGGGLRAVTLEEHVASPGADTMDILALDQALERLAEQEPRKARAVELHFFGGLSYKETAEALEVSEATVDRDIRMARAWLATEMSEDA